MRLPEHIGIIPDGNRRWANEHGMEKHEGYDFGLTPGLSAFSFCKEKGIKELTFYGFTTDNCKRPCKQVSAFTKACCDAVDIISKSGAELLIVGNQNSCYFPEILKKFTTRTKIGDGGIKLNFLVNYGWEWDFSSFNSNSDNRKNILNNLKTRDISPIDMVVRWGGMRRLSGFLPLQTVYSDFYICDSLWPDYKDEDLQAALEWYNKQDVTKGG